LIDEEINMSTGEKVVTFNETFKSFTPDNNKKQYNSFGDGIQDADGDADSLDRDQTQS